MVDVNVCLDILIRSFSVSVMRTISIVRRGGGRAGGRGRGDMKSRKIGNKKANANEAKLAAAGVRSRYKV